MTGRPPSLRPWLLALALALAGLLMQAPPARRQNLGNTDQPRYLSIAHDLLAAGYFTDGREAATATTAAGPGLAVAPLYPALLAGLGALDPTLQAAERCVAQAADLPAVRACPPALGLLIPVQVALTVATLLLTWRLALAVTGCPSAGWAALLFSAFGTGQYAAYAFTAMTEAVVTPLLALLLLAAVRVVQNGRAAWAAAGGAALGLAALTRPEFELLALAALAGGLGLLPGPATRRVGWLLLLLGAVAEALTLPWRLRNASLFGTPAITAGYSGFILAQRVAYQAMNWREWCASWFHALPAFGPALARWLFGSAAVARLGWEERPDTFYMVGNTAMVEELRRLVPDPAAQVSYLLRRYVLPDPIWFALVSLALAWKGLWVRKFVGLPGVPLLARLCVRAWRERRWPTLAMAAPPVLMALFYGAVSVGTPRYNLDLVPCYAVATGAAAGPWAARLLRRLRGRFR